MEDEEWTPSRERFHRKLTAYFTYDTRTQTLYRDDSYKNCKLIKPMKISQCQSCLFGCVCFKKWNIELPPTIGKICVDDNECQHTFCKGPRQNTKCGRPVEYEMQHFPAYYGCEIRRPFCCHHSQSKSCEQFVNKVKKWIDVQALKQQNRGHKRPKRQEVILKAQEKQQEITTLLAQYISKDVIKDVIQSYISFQNCPKHECECIHLDPGTYFDEITVVFQDSEIPEIEGWNHNWQDKDSNPSLTELYLPKTVRL
jgi:hypothetical protein